MGEGMFWTVDTSTARVRSIGVEHQSGTVNVWVKINSHKEALGIDELLVYLTPEEAMAFSKAFERCAIAALKANA